MTNVLSVGAGKEQVPSIIEAKKMGLNVIAVDKDPAAEGFKWANETILIDIKDKDKVIQVAQEYKIKCVLPAPIGRYLTTIGAVNDALHLKGITEEAAINCADKYSFNRLLTDASIPCAKQEKAKTYKEIKENIDNIGLPCILKPRYGSGSRGIVVIEKKEDIAEAINKHMLECDDKEDSLIESFIDGIEYGIDGVVIDNDFKLILVREKILTKLPYRQEITYIAPAKLDNLIINEINNYIGRVCKVLKLNNCLINADLIIKNREITIVEIAGRPAGLNISSIVVPYVTSVNVLKEGIKLALNLETDFNVKTGKPLVLLFLATPVGKVIKTPDYDSIINMESVYKYEPNIEEGDILAEIKDGTDIYSRGYVMTQGNTLEEALNVAQSILNIFEIKSEGD